MVNYANFHQSCIDSALTTFMQYLPFVLLLQAVSIILIEKLLMKFPRVAGKIERFYNTIVEEALFGKDPDVAEDVQDDKGNVEVIARRRRRKLSEESIKNAIEDIRNGTMPSESDTILVTPSPLKKLVTDIIDVDEFEKFRVRPYVHRQQYSPDNKKKRRQPKIFHTFLML